ncbi:MAG TPA: hypothetical protein HPP83_08925 [Candidatus Hydrogenedentes bacterium]|nr:hypothetical protein [Candidatus Hydrogenedentota bacterium]
MKRFLLIGLDGAAPGLVDPWMASGQLSNLKQLRDNGSSIRVKSTIPPATFPAWTTCVTGLNPGRHGIIDFTETTPGAYAIRFVNSTHRKAPALWNILSEGGKRVGVLGVPATYPPEPVNGFMVSGFDSPVATGVDKSFVYPLALYPQVRKWRFADFQETDMRPGWHDRALPKLLDKIADKERIAAELLAKAPWDFFMVVFGESDTVAHHFWMFHDPNSPRHAPGHGDAILRVYERLDAAVGKLVEAAGSDTTVAVVSDHGFGGAGTGAVHLNNWLAENGYLEFSGLGGSPVKRLALSVVPQQWRGAAFRRFRSVAAKAEGRARFAGIDWSRTRAWSEELNYFPSVRVNLRGREPEGQVEPTDYDLFCDRLCETLEAWPPVKKAWRRDELYSGEYVRRAPDIILELALENGYSHSCLRSRGGPSFRRIKPDEYLGGKERGMNGNHRPDGVLILSERTSVSKARLEDVAPTVLSVLDVSGPPMDGQSLLGDLRPDSQGPAGKRHEESYSSEQGRAVEGRLRGLGYFE